MPKDLPAVARSTKYPLDAFVFVQRGLDDTVRRVHGEPKPDADPANHVTGQQLSLGLRDFALLQYGLLARTVLRRWHINSTEDFGQIVFAMVEGGLMKKTAEDSVRDFSGVYDFEEAFSPSVQIGERG
jgi:uncharacterized repeat protein (TIGR04138 family)